MFNATDLQAHRGLCLFQRDAWFAPSDQQQPRRGSILQQWPTRHQQRLHHHRHEDVVLLSYYVAIEPGGRHANDVQHHTVQAQGLTDDPVIILEFGVPIGIAQHCHRISADLVIFLGSEEPAPERLYAERREVIPSDDAGIRRIARLDRSRAIGRDHGAT